MSYPRSVEPEDAVAVTPSAIVPVIEKLLNTGSDIVVGKRHELKLALTCIFAGGHLLIEDQPGVGKTTLAHLIARMLGLEFQRVQFTSDLLPADIIGVSVFERDKNEFRFHKGPVFTNVLLADEVNRATPRAQSALLEAMEERQVSIEGETMPLPQPFFVIATQNPRNQIGTFPLPESQLDRFLMRISLGYPSKDAERELLSGEDRRAMLAELKPQIEPATLVAIQSAVRAQTVSPALLDYVQNLIEYSREAPVFSTGLSPRAGLALVLAAKAWSLLEGRGHVLPEDVKAVMTSVAGHRVSTAREVADGSATDELLGAVPIP